MSKYNISSIIFITADIFLPFEISGCLTNWRTSNVSGQVGATGVGFGGSNDPIASPLPFLWPNSKIFSLTGFLKKIKINVSYFSSFNFNLMIDYVLFELVKILIKMWYNFINSSKNNWDLLFRSIKTTNQKS